MKEYNLLTQWLLAEGYTAENHPDYVQIPNSRWDINDPLHNLQDGFEYTPEYRNKLVFRTGCGLLVKGSYFTGSMGYMGITWIPENNNPVINCPYRKESCELRNPILRGIHGEGLTKILHCNCQQTDEVYNYEKSADKIRDDYECMKKRKYNEFSESVKGHVCHWQMHWSDWTQEWKQQYDPMTCARFCMNTGKECDLRHVPVSKKRGNVFYDVRISYIRHDGTLFDGQEVVRINKGIRLFDTQKSMTICEEIVKRKVEEIEKKEREKRRWEISFRGWKVEVLNIRAEHRENRDLMQDLQDIADGIEVIHASDLKKKEKEDKAERRQQAKKKSIQKLEKKLLEVGYYNLAEYDLNRIHADKWLGKEKIEELERERTRRAKVKENQTVQLSIYDFPEYLPDGKEE